MIRESNLLSSRYEDPILVILFSRKLKGRSDIACAHIFSFTYLIIKLKFLNYPIIAHPFLILLGLRSLIHVFDQEILFRD